MAQFVWHRAPGYVLENGVIRPRPPVDSNGFPWHYDPSQQPGCAAVELATVLSEVAIGHGRPALLPEEVAASLLQVPGYDPLPAKLVEQVERRAVAFCERWGLLGLQQETDVAAFRPGASFVLGPEDGHGKPGFLHEQEPVVLFVAAAALMAGLLERLVRDDEQARVDVIHGFEVEGLGLSHPGLNAVLAGIGHVATLEGGRLVLGVAARSLWRWLHLDLVERLQNGEVLRRCARDRCRAFFVSPEETRGPFERRYCSARCQKIERELDRQRRRATEEKAASSGGWAAP